MTGFLRTRTRVTIICELASGETAAVRVLVSSRENPIKRVAALIVRQGYKLGQVIAVFHGWPSHHIVHSEHAKFAPWTEAVTLVDDSNLQEKGIS
jgi:hypothetical protein